MRGFDSFTVMQKRSEFPGKFYNHRIQVWYIYLHLVDFKYTSPMDPMGHALNTFSFLSSISLSALCSQKKKWSRYSVGSKVNMLTFPYHPWKVYLHLPLFCGVFVGKYASPMDCLGLNYLPQNVQIQPVTWVFFQPVIHHTSEGLVKKIRILYIVHFYPPFLQLTSKKPWKWAVSRKGKDRFANHHGFFSEVLTVSFRECRFIEKRHPEGSLDLSLWIYQFGVQEVQELTYPTFGRGKSSTQKCRLVWDMFERRVTVHPGRLTWNLRIRAPWKKEQHLPNHHFHVPAVNLRGCSS